VVKALYPRDFNGPSIAFASGMMRATWRRSWLWTSGAAVVLLAFEGYAVCARVAPDSAGAHGRASPPSTSVPVVAAHARIGDMGVYLTGLGTVTALKTVTVRTQVDGQLVNVVFKEGQLVRAQQLLAQIDPRPFQVQLEQAEGQAAKDAATLKNARVDLQRYRALVEQQAVPKQQLDTQVSTVQQLEATLKSDQAQIDSARLNLTYARITSPLTGRIGLRLVDPGNILRTTDQNGLAVITERHPSGTLSAVDSQIDPTTGTIKLKATFANDDDALFPNQFVNARLLVQTIQRAIIVPSAAIQRGPQRTFVYVVTPNNTVDSRDVAVSMSEGDETVVTSGLAAGDVVVTDGVDRLQPGARVQVRFADPADQKGRS
jgi:multidrug efflux system membrane fusion protein